MHIQLGDLMRWEDNTTALGANAGQLFLVVGFVDSGIDGHPDVVVLQNGQSNVLSWGLVWSWCRAVQEADAAQ